MWGRCFSRLQTRGRRDATRTLSMRACSSNARMHGTGVRKNVNPNFGNITVGLPPFRRSSLQKAEESMLFLRSPRHVVIPDTIPREDEAVKEWIDKTLAQLEPWLEEEDKVALQKVALLVPKEGQAESPCEVGPIRYSIESARQLDLPSDARALRMFIMQAKAEETRIHAFVAAYEVVARPVFSLRHAWLKCSNRGQDVIEVASYVALMEWMRYHFREQIESESNVVVHMEDIEDESRLKEVKQVRCFAGFTVLLAFSVMVWSLREQELVKRAIARALASISFGVHE